MSKVRIIALLCALILLVVCVSACKKGADGLVTESEPFSSDVIENTEDDEHAMESESETAASKIETGSSNKPASSSSKKPSSSSKTEASSSEPVSSSKPTVSTPAYFPGAY